MSDSIRVLRDRIAKTKAEIETLQRGIVTRDEAAERLIRWVDDGAAQIDLRSVVASACGGSARIDDDVFTATGRVDHLSGGHATDVPMASLFAWAVGDMLKDRLLAKLDELAPDFCTTKDAKARKAALAKKNRELEQLERDEEAAIVKAEMAGHNIARRADCRPEIVLEVASA